MAEASIADLWVLVDQLKATNELARERRRSLRIASGLPADPPPVDYDEMRAQAAVLRAQNDLAEATAILAETRKQGAK